MSCGIALRGVSKRYRSPHGRHKLTLAAALRGAAPAAEDIHALRDISFAVAEGERVGIVGPNGAGKTTLLQIVAGLAEPSAGTVEIEGHVHAVMTLGAVLREEATGRENIFIDGEVQGKTRAEVAPLVQRVVDFSELGDFIDLPVRTYSSGMKARLAFSMVAFIEPEILIIDEALSVGDAAFSRKASARMQELSRAGRIVLVVSHGMRGIVDMCSRCLWIEAGRIVMDGDPAAVTAAYEDSVRVADEQGLRRMFDAGEAMPEGRDGATLTGLALVQGDGASGGTLLMARQDAVLRIAGSGAALRQPDLRLRLVRLDGTLISENRLAQRQDPAALRAAFTVDIAMRPVVLGPSVYRADVALLDGEATIAGRSLVFEVRTDDALMGGVPMLLYPSRLTVAPLPRTVPA